MGLPSLRTLAAICACTAPLAAAAPAGATTITVSPTGSTTAIQAAVDAASPGDTINVRPGLYTGPTVHVDTSRLTIRGPKSAVIDAAGNDFGLTVGPAPNIPAGCGTDPNFAYPVRDFTIDGLTIRNADDTGIFLMGVDRFRVTGGTYTGSGEYGIFPRCSRDGRVDHNIGSGGDDALIYVGVDKRITVEENILTNGELGIELENTDDTIVRGNLTKGNTVGIFVIVLPGLPTDATNRVLIEDNVVLKNNRPNPFPPVCSAPDTPPGCVPDFTEDLQLLPSGSGILNVGGHDVTIRDNVVTGNDTVGIGAVQNPIVGASSDRTSITRNVALRNGTNPDPRSSGAGDIIYLDDPANGSCISRNVFGTSFFPFGAPPACS